MPHPKSQGTQAVPRWQHLVLNRSQCDEGRPSCRRCTQRGEICNGYRDEASLIFRSENDRAARKPVRRRASTQSLSRSATSSQGSVNVTRAASGIFGADDPSGLSTAEMASLSLSSPYPWAKTVPQASVPSAENQAVSEFFERYVMYPCNNGSSPGFLEYLPCLFEEVKTEGRLALRWAVRAAAYANISNDQGNAQLLGQKALHCYGLALAALKESLTDGRTAPDDYTLMTVVVLDLFEVGWQRCAPECVHQLTFLGSLPTGPSLGGSPRRGNGPDPPTSRTRLDLWFTWLEFVPPFASPLGRTGTESCFHRTANASLVSATTTTRIPPRAASRIGGVA